MEHQGREERAFKSKPTDITTLVHTRYRREAKRSAGSSPLLVCQQIRRVSSLAKAKKKMRRHRKGSRRRKRRRVGSVDYLKLKREKLQTQRWRRRHKPVG